jgi:hypothetical protein
MTINKKPICNVALIYVIGKVIISKVFISIFVVSKQQIQPENNGLDENEESFNGSII